MAEPSILSYILVETALAVTVAVIAIIRRKLQGFWMENEVGFLYYIANMGKT